MNDNRNAIVRMKTLQRKYNIDITNALFYNALKPLIQKAKSEEYYNILINTEIQACLRYNMRA